MGGLRGRGGWSRCGVVEAWGGRVELGCWGKGLESREGVSWVVEGWVVWPSEWGLLGEVGGGITTYTHKCTKKF